MTAREAILGKLTDGTGGPLTDPFPAPAVSDDLRALFERRLNELGGRVATWADVARLPDRAFSLEPGLSLPAESGPYREAGPWEASVGVTRVLAAVAETGSLLLAGGPDSCRLASLCPPLHIALVAPEALVDTLEAALAKLPATNCVLVTGPSRTADIEGVMVRGVHGPAELWVVFQTGAS